MKLTITLLAALLLAGCAGSGVKVRVSCDKTGTFVIRSGPGGASKIAMPDCESGCSLCGQVCTIQVIE